MTTLAGYTFTTAAGTLSAFDAQLAAMETAARAAEWNVTLAAYDAVEPTSGISLATLANVGIDAKYEYAMASTAYWQSATHADTFVRAAIGGTGPVAGWDPTSRRELLTKGAAYQVVRQAIIDRLSRGVEACNRGDGASAVYDWEAAYALHAGSLEGADGTGAGKSTYALADKRCPQFGTCVSGSHPARSNTEALAAWGAGIGALRAGDCMSSLASRRRIIAQLTVPLVQGTLREAWEVDPQGGAGTADGVVEVAEGWAFLAAILPQLATCNASAAASVSANMALSLTGSDGAWVSSGFAAVKRSMEGMYGCLGISCADVGGMLRNGDAIPGFEPCSDAVLRHPRWEHAERAEQLQTATVTLGVLLALALAVLCGAFAMRRLAEAPQRKAREEYISSIANSTAAAAAAQPEPDAGEIEVGVDIPTVDVRSAGGGSAAGQV